MNKQEIEWISVDSYKDIPTGNWICYHVDDCFGSRFSAMRVDKNKSGHAFGTAGNAFAFDLPRVTHYSPMPNPPKASEE